jgi:RNA polymerase sigma factor (sigma-70 family)
MHTNVLAEDATEERIPAPRRWVQPPPKLLTHLSDERLVARVRAGDDRAFEALYDRHHRPLLAFCRHLLGSPEEAEDALQHTFIAAHRALRRDERPVMLRAWLFAIARNRCLSVLRSRRNIVALTEVEPTLPATVGLAAQVEQREDLQALVRDLHALSDDQRAALVLSELGDLDHEEIAGVLGVRRARVATLVFQARASLMETRKARESACSDIQEQLATLRGGALRRSTLRRHVDSCSACQAFRAEVRRQRAAMALILPVMPSLGLKRSVLSAISGGGAAGAAAAAGGVSGGVALLGGGAASGGAAASSVVATSAAVAGAPLAVGGAAAAVGGVSAGVAAGGAAVAAAGGVAVAAKALGAKVLLAAAIASGGPGLQAAAEGLGVSEKLQRTPSEAALPSTGGATYTPETAVEKGGDGSREAATGHSGGASGASGSSGSSGSGSGAGAGAGEPTDSDPSATETGSGAGALPEEVVNDDDDGSGMPPATEVPTTVEEPAPAETTPTEAPPAETTPPAETRPAETTPTEAPPAETTPTPPAETTPTQEPPAPTTSEDPPGPPEQTGEGEGDGGEQAEGSGESDGPVATGASVDPVVVDEPVEPVEPPAA